MGRSGYGSVGGRRKGSGGAWQWAVIGLTLGLSCAAILVLVLLTIGVLSLDTGGDDNNSATSVTDVANAPTEQPMPTADTMATVNAIVAETMAALPTTEVPLPSATSGIIVAPTATLPATQAPLQTASTQPTDADTGNLFPNTQDAPSVSGADDGEIPLALQSILTTLVRVDGGSFEMGTTAGEVTSAVQECVQIDGKNCRASDGEDSFPSHPVVLDTFQIEEYEVTNQQYVAFLNWMGPGSHRDGCFGQACVLTVADLEYSQYTFDGVNYDVAQILNNMPATAVTWWGARAYCEAIGRRLPTEAEWERAARGPNNTIYPYGSNRNLEIMRTSIPEAGAGPVEVGSFPSNQSLWGAYDMAGNVAEWVYDFYQSTYYSQPEAAGPNPTGPIAGTERVIRGGSWDTVPFYARSVHRRSARPDDATLSIGFRCAADFEVDGGAAAASNTGSVLDPSSLGPTTDPNVVPTEPPLNAQPTMPPEATSAAAVPPVGNQ